MSESRPKVLVAGASGFAGALAARLVWEHPGLELLAATAREDAGQRLDRLYPRHRVPVTLEELDWERADEADAAIVCYPHGASAPVVAQLRGLGALVVDLSADFRLGHLPTYERYYGPHGAPDLLEGAAYGLTELYREEIRSAGLVANPGCYPTATILALDPLVRAGLISDLVVDAKSGVSGAGRGGGDATHFSSAGENVKPYRSAGHRHEPEIAEQIGRPLTFVPHLVPVDQGELVTCYIAPTEPVDQARLDRIYREAYAGEPFVEVVDYEPGLRDVRETNVCRICPVAREDRILVFAVIDNLWKGASSQAIQNLNLMLGLDEGTGIS